MQRDLTTFEAEQAVEPTAVRAGLIARLKVDIERKGKQGGS